VNLKMVKTKELALRKSGKNLMNELEKEIQEEHINKIKQKAKELMKEIKMTEILLEKKKNALKQMLEGKAKFSEEDLLFEE